MCICSLKENSTLFPAVASAKPLAAATRRAPLSRLENPTDTAAIRTKGALWNRRAAASSTRSVDAEIPLAMDSLPVADEAVTTESDVLSAPESTVAGSSDEAGFQADEVEVAEAPLPIDPVRAAFLLTLQRAKEGDKKAFEEIYQLYHRRIYNAVYGMLSDPDDAQDVTQDVFMRLHDALPTLRADEAFSTYLYRIALNLCRDRARRKKRVRFQSMDTPRADSEGDVEPMEFPDLGKLPEETLANDELQTRVRQAVQTLSVDHKAVIVMHHFQGMEVNDIANILKVPTGTVKSRLARGRDQLHRKLRTYMGAAA